MTLKTSLFNKGIYKSSLRRFMWGSVVYFALLFISTALIILLTIDKEASTYYYMRDVSFPLIFRSDFALFPMLVATIVPTVVALLVFRFVHSKRQAVFVHSLPVSRTANYISSVLAGFTLMAIPVVLNGIILMIISLCGYSEFFTVGSCFIWIAVNLLVLFLLFSYSAFSSMITGNSFAMVALNVLLHGFLLVIAGGFSVMSGKFLYGYAGDNLIFNFLAENLPVPWLYNTFLNSSYRNFNERFSVLALAIHIVLAVVFYVISFVIYMLRKMETAEEVAGFKWLNPLFKYLATTLAALASFGIFASMLNDSWLLVAFIVMLISAIVYVACEMILKKTFKIWRSYKGFLGFMLAAVIVVYTFAFTSFFGYEGFVPKASDVESVAAYNYYYQDEEPWVSDSGVVKYVTEQHAFLTTRKQTLNNWMQNSGELDSTHVSLVYKMKNGDVIKRRYSVEYKTNMEIMNELYKNENYKRASDIFFTEDIADIYRITIYANSGAININDKVQIDGLLECIREDKLGLDYDEMHINYGATWDFNLEVEYVALSDIKAENETTQISTTEVKSAGAERIRYMNCRVNSNYKRTLNWLKNNGYWENFAINENQEVYLYKDTVSRVKGRGEEALVRAKGIVSVDYKEGRDFGSDAYAKLSDEDRHAMFEYVYSANVRDLGCEEYYELYYLPIGADSRAESYRILTSIPADEIPEFLKKYLD